LAGGVSACGAVSDGLKPLIRPLHFWIKLDISLQSQHYAAHAAATSVLFCSEDAARILKNTL